MGRNKLLLPWGDGTLIEHVVDTYLRIRLAELIVVVGCEARRIREALSGRSLSFAENTRYREGMSTSLCCGIRAASTDSAGYLIALADEPLITCEIIEQIIAVYLDERPLIAAASHQGQRGHPVIFSRSLAEELCSLAGDEGGRLLLTRHAAQVRQIEIPSTAIMTDVDTPEEYAGLMQPAVRNNRKMDE